MLVPFLGRKTYFGYYVYVGSARMRKKKKVNTHLSHFVVGDTSKQYLHQLLIHRAHRGMHSSMKSGDDVMCDFQISVLLNAHLPHHSTLCAKERQSQKMYNG